MTLLEQYREMKKKHPDAVLLFRVGDFYECFGEDAIKASEVLGITLTRRANGKAAYTELTGFPHHALDTYLPKLIRAGKRVAICEQLEDPKQSKKNVKRGISELIESGLKPGETRLPNGLIIGEKEKMKGVSFNNRAGRFMIYNNRVGIFIEEPGNNWYFAPLILSSEDEVRYKLYTELSWKYSEWIWVDEYGEDEELVQYYDELKKLYSDFVSKYGFLNSPENAAFIKLDAYSDNLEILEKEVVDSKGDITYIPGNGFVEIEERVNEILGTAEQMDYSMIILCLTQFMAVMDILFKLAEIRRRTEEIRSIAYEIKLSPKIAFNAYYEEINKQLQKSLFTNI